MKPLETNKILSDAFEQLKGPVPIELKLSFKENRYSITAVTLPRMKEFLCVYSYLYHSVHGYVIDSFFTNTLFFFCI
jgi:hypothetical protein